MDDLRRMEPAKTVVYIMGGTKIVAQVAGVHTSQVSKWRWPKERGGTDGLIPMKNAILLLAEARRLGIKLTESDFFPAVEETKKRAAK